MITFLAIIGIIALIIVGLAFYLVNSRRPKFFKGGLNPLEKSLFKELENKMPTQAGQMIPKQLIYLKRGVRLYFEKSYTLEVAESKENPIPEEFRFNRKDEFKLASMSFSINGSKYKADFQTYRGRISGMTVRPNPKNRLGSIAKSFDKFSLVNDPSEELDLKIAQEFYAGDEIFDGILSDLNQKYKLSNIQKPLPQRQRQLFTRLSDTKLPEDYLVLCNQTNGFEINDAVVFGLGMLQSVSMEDDNYLKLAENGDGCLAIKQSKRTTKIKSYSYEDETDVKDMGDSFLSALDHFMLEQ